MEDFKAVLQTTVQIMQQPFNIWGFTLNFWDIMIWSLIAGIILVLIVRFFNE
nr:hypothetical protein [uncultured Dysosmobacter sp.]